MNRPVHRCELRSYRSFQGYQAPLLTGCKGLHQSVFEALKPAR